MTQLAVLTCGRCFKPIGQGHEQECPSCHDFFHPSCLKIHLERTCEVKQKIRTLPLIYLLPAARMWELGHPW